MKVEDVSQDLKYFKGTVLRDLTYAVDEHGEYQGVCSDGWDIKNDALSFVLDDIDDECNEILERIKRGESSPLEYHIKKSLMDVGMLSDYTGIPKRTIKKHFDPKEFAKLDDKTLEIYADALRITIYELKTIPQD